MWLYYIGGFLLGAILLWFVLSLVVPPIIFYGKKTDTWETLPSEEETNRILEEKMGVSRVINLKSDVAKREHITRELTKLGIPFSIFEAYNGRDPEIQKEIVSACNGPPRIGFGTYSCAKSHLLVYEEIVNEPDFDESKWYTVFEDDAAAMEEPTKVRSTMAKLVQIAEERGDTDYIYFGMGPYIRNFPLLSYWVINKRLDEHLWRGPTLATHAIAFRGAFLKELIVEMQGVPCKGHIDEKFSRFSNRNMLYFRKEYNPWFPASQFFRNSDVPDTDIVGEGLFSQRIKGEGMSSSHMAINRNK